MTSFTTASIAARAIARSSLRSQTIPSRTWTPTLTRTTLTTGHASLQTRLASTEPTKQVGNVTTPGFRPRSSTTGPSAVRVGTLFTSLVALAIAVTSYGLYEYYTSFSAWPVSIRDDLRAALKARNRGDTRRAESYFRKALSTARSIKGELNEPTPTPKGQPEGQRGEAMLKISGIAIALAALLENEGRVGEAYEVLEDVWEEVMEQGKYSSVVQNEKGEYKRGDRDRMRGVQLAQKLGLLGQLPEVRVELLSKVKARQAQDGDDGKPVRFALTGTAESQDPAERWLVWSVEELFRLVLPADVHASALSAARQPEDSTDKQSAKGSGAGTLNSVTPPTSVSLADLDLPAWVTKLDLLSSIEALGTFYAGKGLPEYAVPLYLQTLSILLPPTNTANNHSSTASERCKAGLIMNNLSQLLSSSNIKDATKWALKGLDITDKTVQLAGFEASSSTGLKEVVQSTEERTQEVKHECLGVKLTLLYNLGVLSDMAGDKCQARVYFQKAYKTATGVEGEPAFAKVAKAKAAESLARLERRGADK
ncbi:uncharacterized protein UBRO_01815 [Ustilago bromivora]|nr:uncharacterized protein UBRO_01815 [Ustilago bromivora]